jgi:hypothetical protein
LLVDINSEGIPVLLRTQDLNAVAPIPLVTKTSGATIVLFGAALFCLTWLTSFVHGRRLAYSYLDRQHRSGQTTPSRRGMEQNETRI